MTGARLPVPAFGWLIRAKIRGRLNRAWRGRGRGMKLAVLAFVGVFFWALVFAVTFRMLLYFRGTQGIGDLLAAKLLGLALVTFLAILLLSNVLASLSTFFLARDLELVGASPADPVHFYGARLVETLVNSSWMVALLAVPLLTAYGVVYGAGPSFYALAAAVMALLLVLPAVVGSALTLLLVSVFPARRAREVLALGGLFALAGVIVLFRLFRPERLVRPDEFRDLVDFLAVLRTPASPWLPSQWATDALMSHLGGAFEIFPLLLLCSSAAAFFVLGAAVHQKFYASGFSRAQEGALRRETRAKRGIPRFLLVGTSLTTRQLVAKEVRIFFRDTTQWSQLLLLGVLVAVYVYNIKVLPLYTGERVSFFLVNLVSFLNLGLAGFVVAAIAARFVFPAMSLEGRTMWLLRSSPLDAGSLFQVKYWVGTVPLLIVALALILITNAILRTSSFVMVLTTVTMVVITFAMTSMALGLGALFPNLETENAAEIPMSFGGLLFMMMAVSYLAAVVLMEAWPVYWYLSTRTPEPGRSAAVGPIALALAGTGALSLLAIVVPLHLGVRHVRNSDLSG